MNSTVLESDLASELELLDKRQLKRFLRSIEQSEGKQLQLEGKSLINFASNNYLGLARHPQVLEAVRQVLEHWGIGATSSRLISGTYSLHRDLEEALAAFMRMEAALVFPTGYMANLGVITTLAGKGDAIILDRLCHASLIDAAHLSGARMFVYDHLDMESARRALTRAASYRRRLLVTDSLFSMDGDFAPLAELSDLAREFDAISILDEAHAIGVWGEAGNGARHGVRTSGWDVVVGTLSKALGSQGGFVCGSRAFVDKLLNSARSFIYTTGLSPACVAAAHASLSLIQENAEPRLRLQKLSTRLRDALRAAGWNTLGSQSQIVPILLGNTERALAYAAKLEDAGFYAPAIRPPTVHSGECRIRFSVTTDHSESDIDRLVQALGEGDE